VELAADYGQEVTFIWCHAPREVCEACVKSQDSTEQRKAARLRFIATVEDICFQAIEKEDPDEVLGKFGRLQERYDDSFKRSVPKVIWASDLVHGGRAVEGRAVGEYCYTQLLQLSVLSLYQQ
jgi:hypothetical protein